MHSDRAGKLTRSDEEWKALTLEQYRVTRQHGTERAFSNPAQS
jgi:peptide methionine sulfoxide reductase MsrB